MKSKEPLKQYNNEEADIRMMYNVAQGESNAVIPTEDTNILILYPKSQNLKHVLVYENHKAIQLLLVINRILFKS